MNHCAECGTTDVIPHRDFPEVDDACLCEECGERWHAAHELDPSPYIRAMHIFKRMKLEPQA